MIQKRCLNCGLYLPDDLDLEGDPIPDTIPASFGFSGVCSSTGKRVLDGWSCGKWTAKSDSIGNGVTDEFLDTIPLEDHLKTRPLNEILKEESEKSDTKRMKP